MTKVLATGVFNLVHPGHLYFLEEAKKLGDELVVIVASDKIASKAKRVVVPQEQRAHIIQSLKPVDKVFIGDDTDTMKFLPQIRPDIIALGHDQEIKEDDLTKKLVSVGIEAKIVRLDKLHGSLNSTSQIVNKLRE